MKNIIVRKASLEDYETLLSFEQGIIAAERPFDSTLADNPINYYDIRQMLLAPHIHLVVAERDRQVVACGYARIEDSKLYLKHRQHAYLGFMYTLQAFRGQGINHLIIEALRKWSTSQGISELRLEVYAGNINAQRAYSKSGFVAHMIEMRMSSEPDDF